MGLPIKEFDHEQYIFLGNHNQIYDEHMLQTLKLSQITEYRMTEAYNVYGDLLKDHHALWIPVCFADKNDIFYDTSIKLRKCLKKKLLEKGYDIQNYPLEDIYYGMDVDSLPHF